VIETAAIVAKELVKIVDAQNLCVNLQGRKYPTVEAWTTMGAMLGIVPREVSCLRQDDGGYLATVELIKISTGEVIGCASSLCGMDETWGKRPEYARRSMAVTRATGKAYRLGFSWIMSMAGYQPTPAEEMDQVKFERSGNGKHHEPEHETAAPVAPDADAKLRVESTFGEFGISRSDLERYLAKPIAEWTADDISRLRVIYTNNMQDPPAMVAIIREVSA